MHPIKIKTKWISIKIYRKSIVFSVANILLASGVMLCTENIIISLLSIINESLGNQTPRNMSMYFGSGLISVSLFLYYLLITNWRKDIYSKVFNKIQSVMNSFGTAWNHRIYQSSSQILRELNQKNL